MRQVAGSFFQHLYKMVVQRQTGEQFFTQLKPARGVPHDLHGLKAADFIEEPGATCVHEHEMALHLEQLENGEALGSIERAAGVLIEKAIDIGEPAVEHDFNVGIARGPRVVQQSAGQLLEVPGELIAQPIEGLAHTRAPWLPPAGASGVASAVAAPAFDAVSAAPRTFLYDLDLVHGRMVLEKLAVVGELN